MQRRWLVGRELSRGAPIPRGWRMGWYEPRRRVGVWFPPPLDWLARAVREIAWRIELAMEAPSRERKEFCDAQRLHRERERLAEEFARGYMRGWRECFEACIEALESEMGWPRCSSSGPAWRH